MIISNCRSFCVTEAATPPGSMLDEEVMQQLIFEEGTKNELINLNQKGEFVTNVSRTYEGILGILLLHLV